MPQSRNRNNGLKLYNRLSREFTKYNGKLPPDKRLHVIERRRIISQKLYPHFKDQKGRIKAADVADHIKRALPLYYRVAKAFDANNKELVYPARERRRIIAQVLYPKVADLKGYIKQADISKAVKENIKDIPPVEICNPLYFPESVFGIILWFEIDDHLRGLSDCINVRVNAGEFFGKTKIFNTRDYEYNSTGVRRITETIRRHLQENGLHQSEPDYKAVIKLIPGKPDDGQGENYFIDYILQLNNRPVDDDKGTEIKVPESKRTTIVQQKINEAILNKMAKLKVRKKKEKSAQKTRTKNKNVIKKVKAKVRRKPDDVRLQIEYQKEFRKNLRILTDQYKKGYLNKRQLDSLIKAITINKKKKKKPKKK